MNNNKLRGALDRPTCPNTGEQYRPSTDFGERGDVTEYHPVRTSSSIEVRDCQPVLVLKARCSCGWSATNVIGDSDE